MCKQFKEENNNKRDMFIFLADKFIEIVNQRTNIYVLDLNSFGSFGFEWQQNYTGLMSQPARTGKNRGKVARAKQGLFDIKVNAGNLFNGDITHRALLELILANTTEEQCLKIWRGFDPKIIGKNNKEIAILEALLLLFFEQELNWGKEVWQRGSNFPPKVRTPNEIRPRDMLMGYISQAYSIGIDNVKYWQEIRPSTTTFMAPDGSTKYFQQYPYEYKKYFDDLIGDEEAVALMVGQKREDFKELAKNFKDNPKF